MRIAACTAVAVLGISLEALAQPPAHAHGKALGHAHGFGHGHAYAFGHARRAEFAANDFKVGLPAGGEASSPGATIKPQAPARRPDAPGPSSGAPDAKSLKGAIPDCVGS